MAALKRSSDLLRLKSVSNSGRSASIWSVMAGKWRKFVNGSERPLVRDQPRQPDSILEEIYAINPQLLPYERRDYCKRKYMFWISHQKIIQHNKRIRQLDKKIKSGRYDNWDYANKW